MADRLAVKSVADMGALALIISVVRIIALLITDFTLQHVQLFDFVSLSAYQTSNYR
jgi:hypothetical protein